MRIGRLEKPLLKEDSEGTFLSAPYPAPAGFRWLWEILSDAGADEDYWGYPVLDGANWGCRLERA